jgi:hypothetical protein
MVDLLREAEDIAYGGKTDAALLSACQVAWNTVRVTAPERLAAATRAAWIAEARAAKTAYSKNCCLEAARKWKERIG